MSVNNRVFPEATAKIYAAVINTNEMEKKFLLIQTFFSVCPKRFDFQKIGKSFIFL